MIEFFYKTESNLIFSVEGGLPSAFLFQNGVFMGGRGAKGSGKHGKINKTIFPGGESDFFDKTLDFAGMSMHEFESAIRGKSDEYLGGFDSSGNLIFAGTSKKGAFVSIPKELPDFEKVTTLIHNHPLSDERPLGGTFSAGDVLSFAKYPQLNSIRVVAGGKGEHLYIMQKSAGGKADAIGLSKSVISIRSGCKFQDMSIETAEKVRNNVKRPLTKVEESRAFIGGVKNIWRDVAEKYGFEYVVLKKAPW